MIYYGHFHSQADKTNLLLPMANLIHTRILGMGSFGPDRVVDNQELSKTVDTSDEWIRARTGIKERRFASNLLAIYPIWRLKLPLKMLMFYPIKLI
jgi:hypothetical protein